jgi:hypothetical protein
MKAQLKVLVSYKKQKADKWQLPTTVAALLEKWEIIKDRLLPEELLLDSMEEQENNNHEDENDEGDDVIKEDDMIKEV